MLRRNFPRNDSEAKTFGGFMSDEKTFCRHFDCSISYAEALSQVNIFLFDNGFTKIDDNEFDKELGFHNSFLSLSRNGHTEKLVLYITDPTTIHDLDSVIKKLITFRDERDWKQFHSSKDLALAITIEAAELQELFLWRKDEDFDLDNLKEELADVLSFCFLLAEKHGLSVPEIINNKIVKNAHKYPIAKAKGSSAKYTNL